MRLKAARSCASISTLGTSASSGASFSLCMLMYVHDGLVALVGSGRSGAAVLHLFGWRTEYGDEGGDEDGDGDGEREAGLSLRLGAERGAVVGSMANNVARVRKAGTGRGGFVKTELETSREEMWKWEQERERESARVSGGLKNGGSGGDLFGYW